MKFSLYIFFLLITLSVRTQTLDSLQIKSIYDYSLTNSSCYENLRSLCKDVGHRLSGSKSAQKAVEWAEYTMKTLNL